MGTGNRSRNDDRVTQCSIRHPPLQQRTQAPAGDRGGIVEGQQALQAAIVEIAVTASLSIQRRHAAWILFQLPPQWSGILAAAVLQQSHRKCHAGRSLAAYMHQVAAHHAIAVEHQIVVGLARGRRAGNGRNGVDGAVHRDQGAGVARQLAQGLATLADAEVAIKIEADRPHPGALQSLDCRHQNAIVERPAQPAQVAFLDSHHPDRQAGRRWQGANGQGKVVDAKVEELRQPRLVQQQQHQNRQAIGEEAAQKRKLTLE